MAPRAGHAGNLRVAGARAVGARHLRRPEARAAAARRASRRDGAVHFAPARAPAPIAAFAFRSTPRSIDSIPASPTVIATPATSAAQLLAPHAPALAGAHFGDPHRAAGHGHDVFRSSPRRRARIRRAVSSRQRSPARSACCSTPTSSRAAATVRSETWIVGDRDIGMTDWADDRLREALTGDRQLLTGRRDTPLAVHVTRWPQAIPVYDRAIIALKAELPRCRPGSPLPATIWERLALAALLARAESAAARLAAGTSIATTS